MYFIFVFQKFQNFAFYNSCYKYDQCDISTINLILKKKENKQNQNLIVVMVYKWIISATIQMNVMAPSLTF